jgi:signal transduction histidine kinase
MKPNSDSAVSLQRYFSYQAIRWSCAGFFLTVLFAIPCILYSEKLATERQLFISAKSAARAFRPMILQENIRDAQFQMRKALDLKKGESAIVRTPDLSPIYPLEENDRNPKCTQSAHTCWSKALGQVSLLYPIYFDEQKQKGLFGYLELSLKPNFDFTVVSVLLLLLVVATFAQAIGLMSALTQSGDKIIAQLSAWAIHLRKSPGLRSQENTRVPYTELHSMQEAVDGLYLEIEKLREKSAAEARIEAQLTLLREISHDLKTPHSLLAKYFAILLDTLETKGVLDPIEVHNVERMLNRMGDILRQVCEASFNQPLPAPHLRADEEQDEIICDFSEETASILRDFQNEDQVIAKKVKIISNLTSVGSAKARISTIEYSRIVTNLIKNAVEAVPPDIGAIHIYLKNIKTNLALVVEDNGPGIDPGNLARIFEFDFTSKPTRGTGLGLGIVSKICQEFGAILEVENRPAGGCRFTVLFQSLSAPIRDLKEQLQHVAV